MKKTPAEIADDPVLELSVSLREQIRGMTERAFKRIPRKIREELGVVPKKSHFLPAKAKGVLWKCNKRLMLKDKRMVMRRYEVTDVALVPMRIVEGSYQICLSEVVQFKDPVRKWVEIGITGRVYDLEGEQQQNPQDLNQQ